MGRYRKFLFPLVFFGVLFYALFHVLTHESSVLYRQGKEHYEQGDYRRAHQLFVEAVQANRYNQRALLMQRNARFAVMTLEVSETIDEFLEKSDSAIANKDFDRADRLLQSALLAMIEIRKRELGDMARVDALEVKVQQKRSDAQLLAREYHIQQAQQHARDGELRLAYSYTEKIQPRDLEVHLLQSRIAMEIARRDIENLLTGDKANIPAHQIRFILHWLNQVHSESSYYPDALRLKERLEILLQGSTP